MQLRPYQVEAIERTRRSWAAGHRAILLVAPTGSGKTVIFSALAQSAIGKGGRGLVLAHRAELVDQAAAKLAALGLNVGIIKAGRVPNPAAHVQVASTQTLLGRDLPPASFVIVDECVSGDTMLGDKRACDIRVGDSVPTPFGPGSVSRTWERTTSALVRIETAGGRTLFCTPNHMVWTERGFVRAEEIKINDKLCPEDHGLSLRRLRGDVRDCSEHLAGQGSERIKELLSGLQDGPTAQGNVGGHVSHEPEVRQRENDGEQPHATGRCASEGCGIAASNWAQAQDPGWQRARADCPSVEAPGRLERGHGRVEPGVCGSDEQDCWGAASLQDRHCEPRVDGSGRSGRLFSLCDQAQGTGCAEGCLADGSRLDRVSSVERRSVAPCTVYDFEIDGAACYFANGILTHNCHHYPSEDTEWGSIVAAYKGATIFGFTATPERGDGAGLSQFQDLVVVAQPRELIEAGYLVPVEVYRPDAVSKTLAMDPVAGYLAHGVVDGVRRKAILFPGSIRAGEDIAHRLDRLGVPAACITQRTPPEVRALLVERFRLGSLLVLVGVHVLTEGLDVPDAFLAILGTKCASPGSLIQKTGRVMRPAEGKTFCRVLDLMGATHLHGLPDDDREFSLAGKPIRTRSDLPSQIQCEACGRVFRGDEFADHICPACGAVKRGKIDPRARERALELAKESRAAKYPPSTVKFVADTIQMVKRRGYPRGRKAVQMIFLKHYHHYPSNALVERAGGWQGL